MICYPTNLFGRFGMHYLRLTSFVLAFALIAQDSKGEVVFNIGNHVIDAAPLQTIDLMIVSNDVADPNITGFNLRAQLGDGLGAQPEPIFTEVDYSSGLFAGLPVTITGGPLAGNEQFIQGSVVFNNTGDAVAPNGLLATVTIDATGFGAGETFDFLVAGTDIGQDSDLILSGGGSLVPTIANGTITISAIPEPGTASCLLAVGAAIACRRRRRL